MAGNCDAVTARLACCTLDKCVKVYEGWSAQGFACGWRPFSYSQLQYNRPTAVSWHGGFNMPPRQLDTGKCPAPQ